MMKLWNKLNNNKTYIGVTLGGLLALGVGMELWSMADKWVQLVATGITWWTGVAIAHKGNKIVAASKGK